MSLNFGTDFSSQTTLGPVASAVLAQLSSGAQTIDELREVTGRSDIAKQVRSLVERSLVKETVLKDGTVRFSLNSKSARHLASSLREVNVTRRMGVVVSGVPVRDAKRLRSTVTFR